MCVCVCVCVCVWSVPERPHRVLLGYNTAKCIAGPQILSTWDISPDRKEYSNTELAKIGQW